MHVAPALSNDPSTMRRDSSRVSSGVFEWPGGRSARPICFRVRPQGTNMVSRREGTARVCGARRRGRCGRSGGVGCPCAAGDLLRENGLARDAGRAARVWPRELLGR